ncbi:MAG TPA: hypothetical protein VHX11_07805 [Acidobacteriaceae bacterium]|jgi:hypothetical protein|nr:hypothetical protein [Acidobacteriaceae bacterium]
MAYEVRDKEVQATLAGIGRVLKESMPEGWGFTLLITSYGAGGAVFYLSSCERQDMIATMREFIQKHEFN